MQTLQVDICIIGAGSGGLSVAAVTAQMGLNVVLIERGKMGGDCLNYGCVPSKSLLAAGKIAAIMRRYAEPFGIANMEPQVDHAKVHDHVHGVIATIAPHDSVERFEGLGVKVIQATGRFIDERTVEAGDYCIRATRFVIATGSSPVIPPITGLDQLPCLTNETIFDLREKPTHLIVIGGGPIGVELAQANLMLGAKVTVLARTALMPKDDADCVAMVRAQLQKEGMKVIEGLTFLKAEKTSQGVAVIIEKNGEQQRIEGSHILVATGREPNIQALDLAKAGVVTNAKGVVVDARLRSSNKKIFAVGDAAGGLQFTHLASYHAGIVIRNIVFHLPAKVDYRCLPWVTFTHPELAHVGIHEAQAVAKNLEHKVLTFDYHENDRAQTERDTVGMIKVVVTPKGDILGATIVGYQAGELLMPWVLAMNNKLKISAMASVIAPYPTLSEISKRAAGNFYTPTLYGDKMKRLVKWLKWLPW